MVTRVLLVDDHRLVTDSLRTVLEGYRDVEVVGAAQNGIEAVALALDQRPDIILLDISMPQLNGIDAARRILKDIPEVGIIMLSMHSDRHFIQEALRIGARGYILKESALQEVIDAIRAVRRGEVYFSPAVHDQVLQDYVEHLKHTDSPAQPELSGREREVLQLLAEGQSTKQIAATLNVSVKTIESHRNQIMSKLNLHSIAELTKYAIRQGLTRLD